MEAAQITGKATNRSWKRVLSQRPFILDLTHAWSMHNQRSFITRDSFIDHRNSTTGPLDLELTQQTDLDLEPDG